MSQTTRSASARHSGSPLQFLRRKLIISACPSGDDASLRSCQTLCTFKFGDSRPLLNRRSDQNSLGAPPAIPYPAGIRLAGFIERPNRFVAIISVDGRRARAHVADPGRLLELLMPGVELLVEPALVPRSTEFTVRAVRHNSIWVGIDSRVPNALTRLALEQRFFQFLPPYESFRPEVSYPGGRVDFVLETDRGQLYLEVKGCSLVEAGHGLFPDAPTTRGRRHLQHLIDRALSGLPAALLFIAGRDDLDSVGPNRRTDPEFADLLRKAADVGVILAAYSCRIDETGVRLSRPLSVSL